MFRSVEKEPVLSFGIDSTGQHRISGKWQQSSSITAKQKSWLSSLAAAMHALPRWPLADGLDLSTFIPDSHQLAVTDKLASSWFQFIDGMNQSYPRTRVVVADEGGIGKTLSVSIAVRWISLREDASGPILILVPPLLTEHWATHLRAVFSDDPDRVRVLSSARYFDTSIHNDDIIVASKFSWIHHMQDLSSLPSSLCVVIDEAHQGRTGMGFNNIDHEDFYEDNPGGMHDHEEVNSTTSHAEVLQATCAKAQYAIAVTATPINTDMDELNYILKNISAEEQEFTFSSPQNDDLEEWFNALRAIKHWARDATDSAARCPSQLVLNLASCIDNNQTPRQWEMLAEQDLEIISSWLHSQSIGDSLLSPELSLTLVREFHPYGRHLSMILRSDLPRKTLDNQKFRKREERRIDLSYDDNLKHFMNNIRRNDSEISRTTKLTGPARLISSFHRNPQAREKEILRYSGEWSFTPESGLDWDAVAQYKDPRFQIITGQIEDDLSNSLKGDEQIYQRGCVIFTEFRGSIHFLFEEFRKLRDHHSKVTLVPMVLKGDTHINEARRILEQCRNKSINKKFYPILICTPAGEVGLDMEWATTLVHWDLNPNPQRLEQRTWRLDRRISSDKTNPKYTVLFPMLIDMPHYSELEIRIVSRYNEANQNLFNQSRSYIPEDQELVDFSKLSNVSNNEFQLLDEEVLELNRFLHDKGEGGWPGPQLRQSEQLRLSVLLDLVSFKHADNTVISSGQTGSYEGWSSELSLGDDRISAVRDLEVIFPALSRKLSPSIPFRIEPKPLITHWAVSNAEGIRLPNLIKTAYTLFRNIPWKEESSKCPVLTVKNKGHTGTYLMAVNPDLASRFKPLSPTRYDRGLRLFYENGTLVSENMDEKEEWELIFTLLCELVKQQPSNLVSTPKLNQTLDTFGQQQATERIEILNRRQLEQRNHLERLKEKMDQMDTESEKHHRFSNVCEELNQSIESRDKKIKELIEMSHELFIIAKFELS